MENEADATQRFRIGTPKLLGSQWSRLWKPGAAEDVMLAVRCPDGAGAVQSGEMKGPGPDPLPDITVSKQ